MYQCQVAGDPYFLSAALLAPTTSPEAPRSDVAVLAGMGIQAGGARPDRRRALVRRLGRCPTTLHGQDRGIIAVFDGVYRHGIS